jgi:hypothetical protein
MPQQETLDFVGAEPFYKLKLLQLFNSFNDYAPSEVVG